MGLCGAHQAANMTRNQATHRNGAVLALACSCWTLPGVGQGWPEERAAVWNILHQRGFLFPGHTDLEAMQKPWAITGVCIPGWLP